MRKIKISQYVYLDFVRILALFCIILMHTGIEGTPNRSVVTNAVIALTRVGVPLFFMVSGALLLGREESFKQLLTHRFLRFCVVIVLLQAVQYLYMFRDDLSKVYLQYYCQILYSGEFAAHTWYLYSYLAFILMLPLLRKLVKGMEKKDYLYAIAIYLVYRLIYSARYVLWEGQYSLNPDFRVSFFLALDAVFYPLLGYFLHSVIKTEDVRGAKPALLAAAGAAAIALTLVMRSISLRVCGQDGFDLYMFAAVPAAALFLLLRLLFEKRPPREGLSRCICFTSRMSFGTYLLHNMYLELTGGMKEAVSAALNYPVACVIQVAIVILIGTAVSFVLKQIPGIRRLL